MKIFKIIKTGNKKAKVKVKTDQPYSKLPEIKDPKSFSALSLSRKIGTEFEEVEKAVQEIMTRLSGESEEGVKIDPKKLTVEVGGKTFVVEKRGMQYKDSFLIFDYALNKELKQEVELYFQNKLQNGK